MPIGARSRMAFLDAAPSGRRGRAGLDGVCVPDDYLREPGLIEALAEAHDRGYLVLVQRAEDAAGKDEELFTARLYSVSNVRLGCTVTGPTARVAVLRAIKQADESDAVQSG